MTNSVVLALRPFSGPVSDAKTPAAGADIRLSGVFGYT
jgi:hypothetical protein